MRKNRAYTTRISCSGHFQDTKISGFISEGRVRGTKQARKYLTFRYLAERGGFAFHCY
jgi:hypothetical protein